MANSNQSCDSNNVIDFKIDLETPLSVETLEKIGFEKACLAFIKANRLDLLKLSRNQTPPYPWDADACLWAAYGNNLPMLQYLIENGCPWYANLYQIAAHEGYDHIIEYAKSQDSEGLLNEYACSNAAEGGQLETLKLLRSYACPWNSLTCIQALRNGHHNIYEWAIENGCPCS